MKHISIFRGFNIDARSREPYRLSRLRPTLGAQLLLIFLLLILLGGTHCFLLQCLKLVTPGDIVYAILAY
jgi:hypothetical protein